MTLSWKAWHADGSVYSSDEYKWSELPRDSIVIVTGEVDGQKFIESGHDAIYFDGQVHGRTEIPFVGVNLPHAELSAVAASLAEQGLLRYGKYLPNERYEEIWQRAYRESR